MKCTKCNVELANGRTICPLCGCRAVNEPARLICTPFVYPARSDAPSAQRRGLLQRLRPTRS